MAGRKRRSGVTRGKDGRIKASEYRKAFDSGAAKWARVRETLREIGSDPRMAGEPGRRHFLGDITSAQYQAVVTFGSMLDIYDWKILDVRRHVPAHVIDQVRGAGVEQWDDDRLASFKREVEGLEQGVREACGFAVLNAVKRFCHGEHADLQSVIRGLDVLVDLLKIPSELDDAGQITNDAKYKVLKSV